VSTGIDEKPLIILIAGNFMVVLHTYVMVCNAAVYKADVNKDGGCKYSYYAK